MRLILLRKLAKGITNLSALALRLNIPCKASAPHLVANGFKNLCGLAMATDCMFKQAQCFSAGPAVAEVKKEEKKPEKKKEEPKPKVEEPEEDFGVGDMFG